MSTDICELPPHDGMAWMLSSVVSVGIIASYIPQIVRIVSARSSVGLSPWFLFLGTLSSWATMLNVLVLQWPVLSCTFRHWSLLAMEYWMGVIQTGVQQLMFTILFACFLRYYPLDMQARRRRRSRKQRKLSRAPVQEADLSLLRPPPTQQDSSDSDSDVESFHHHIHKSYGTVAESANPTQGNLASHAHSHDAYHNIPAHMRDILERHLLPSEEAIHGRVGAMHEYAVARRLAWTAACLILAALGTSVVLLTGHAPRVRTWANVLGVAASVLTMCQYVPQIVHTARARLVRSMSITMMCIQVPGAALFVYALAQQVGVDWSSLMPFLVAATLQGILLILCIVFKIQQRRAGIDDYGQHIGAAALSA